MTPAPGTVASPAIDQASPQLPGVKPWPTDAVIVVAAIAGQEIREHMEGVLVRNCSDCGQVLHADTRTARAAEELPSRHNRPIEYLCVECAVTYDVRGIELHDLRGGQS